MSYSNNLYVWLFEAQKILVIIDLTNAQHSWLPTWPDFTVNCLVVKGHVEHYLADGFVPFQV